MKTIVIGAGPAGVSVVETLRALDCQMELVMFSAEATLPYSPPAMADHFMTGSGAHLWRGADWPVQMGVDYRSGVTVAAIEPEAHQVRLVGGEVVGYDRLVIATGSRLHAPVEGADRPGVYNFKSLSAAESLVAQVRGGAARTAVIVGAGFIGMEIALLLCDLGVAVTLVEMLDQVMSSMLDAETAALALDLMRARGVTVRLGAKARAFIGNDKAAGIQMENGETIAADILIAATGVRPNLELLQGSGIAHGWGIKVDDRLRTSAPDIYAAGDAVEVPDRLTGEVYVHAIFPNAIEQGRVVGLNLAGYDTVYEGAERLNSLKHLGLPILAVGLKQGDEVLRAQRNGRLRTIYLRDQRVVGFQLAGEIRSAGILRALLLSGRDVRPFKARLLDPQFGQGILAWQAMQR
jgi:NADPH-dependent 2,4-dienoyl-CoA reductase/sulfur reductase-like enzyme